MPMRLIPIEAPIINAMAPDGTLRSMARAIGHAHWGALDAPSRPAFDPAVPGRVTSFGTFDDAAVSAGLAHALGEPYATALRSTFEWYACRGAAFHNDAHYPGVLFGVWCVAGAPMELVFARAGARLAIAPGCIAVFDPFEVHGVLKPGRALYAAEDYTEATPSVFVGFELTLAPDVAAAFGIGSDIAGHGDGPIVSSRTRITATDGAFE